MNDNDTKKPQRVINLQNSFSNNLSLHAPEYIRSKLKRDFIAICSFDAFLNLTCTKNTCQRSSNGECTTPTQNLERYAQS